MTKVQLVTVEGCPGVSCPHCEEAEEVLRAVMAMTGVPLPPHSEGGRGEAFVEEGRSIEVEHLDCEAALARHLDPEQAPFLFVDGELVQKGAGWDRDRMARVVREALWPEGTPQGRP